MTSQEKRHNDFEDWKLDLEARLALYLFQEEDFKLNLTPAPGEKSEEKKDA